MSCAPARAAAFVEQLFLKVIVGTAFYVGSLLASGSLGYLWANAVAVLQKSRIFGPRAPGGQNWPFRLIYAAIEAF